MRLWEQVPTTGSREQMYGRAEGAHKHFGEEMTSSTCCWCGVDPVHGHVPADVKNFRALQELFVLDGLFPRHPDYRLLKVSRCDFFSLEEE